MPAVHYSLLAQSELHTLPKSVARQILRTVRSQVLIFPESGPPVHREGYQAFRQLIVSGYRVIYRFFPDEDIIRIYFIISTRRQLPPAEFITYQAF